MWTLETGAEFCRMLSKHLAPIGFGVGLCGSVLSTGESTNDLDIIVFPHDSTNFNWAKAFEALRQFGMRRRIQAKAVKEFWRQAGTKDEKLVEVWSFQEGRVDIFFLK